MRQSELPRIHKWMSINLSNAHVQLAPMLPCWSHGISGISTRVNLSKCLPSLLAWRVEHACTHGISHDSQDHQNCAQRMRAEHGQKTKPQVPAFTAGMESRACLHTWHLARFARPSNCAQRMLPEHGQKTKPQVPAFNGGMECRACLHTWYHVLFARPSKLFATNAARALAKNETPISSRNVSSSWSPF